MCRFTFTHYEQDQANEGNKKWMDNDEEMRTATSRILLEGKLLMDFELVMTNFELKQMTPLAYHRICLTHRWVVHWSLCSGSSSCP